MQAVEFALVIAEQADPLQLADIDTLGKPLVAHSDFTVESAQFLVPLALEIAQLRLRAGLSVKRRSRLPLRSGKGRR